MKRKLNLIKIFGVTISVVVLLSGATLMILIWEYDRATVIVTNKTGLVVSRGLIKTSSMPRNKEIGKIENGDSTRIQFRGAGDAQYILKAKFQNGDSILDSGGYVTNGFDAHDNILLYMENDSIKMKVR